MPEQPLTPNTGKGLKVSKLTPRVGRRVHLALMVFWALNFVAFWFIPHSWRIPYLIIVSIYANFVGHWSGYSAERPSEVVDS